jgi:uncharacterized protein YndB with AHSA1/START domain
VKTIHHVLDIDSDGAAVWDALTTEAGLAGWWTSQVSVDGAGAGTRVSFVFGGDFNPVMQVTEAADGQRLAWRCIDGHDNWKDNTFTFELAGLPDGRTRLRFTQDYATELSDDDYGIYNFNWGYYLESLRLLLTTGTGQPYRPGHA